MRSTAACVAVMAALAPGSPLWAETIDRIAVTVGPRVIAESEVILDLRVAALLDQKPVDLSGDAKRKAADRLIDQILILKEAEFSRIAAPPADEVAKMLEQVKMLYGAGYAAGLRQYHVTEAEVLEHLAAGLRALRFTDLRFRPEVQVSAEDLRDFYEQLIADSNRTNAPAPKPFDDSREELESLLVEQRVTQSLDRWLGDQRTQTEILYREAALK